MLDPVVFELPDRRSPEAFGWAGHIPFVFWLVKTLKPHRVVELGTHWGHSYFAMCEAIDRLGLEAEAFAVDTWMGDEHAGFYGDEVFDDVDAWNSGRFGGFSTLLRMTFDDARCRFADGTVDLLHIDGLHSYEAVLADFEAWVPKVSDGGIVLLHDTAERKEGFGVYRFFHTLQERYPTFQFEHSHGLGVVGVGRQHPQPIRQLFKVSEDSERAPAIREFFAALGDRVLWRVEIDRRESEHRAASAELEHRQGVIDGLAAEAEHRQGVIDGLAAEAAHRQGVIDGLAAEAAHRQGVIDGLAAEAAHRLDVIDGLAVEAAHRLDVIDGLAEEAEHRLAVINEVVQQRDEAIETDRRIGAELETLQRRIAKNPLTRMLLGKQHRRR